MEINNELKCYIEDNVLSEYEANDIGGHGREHIESVIERSFELVNTFNLSLNLNMVYTIAAYHDIGYKENPEKHEEESSKKFLNDMKMKEFFNEDERLIIAEAIVDHRASLEYEARSEYGKLVSSADRAISVPMILNRSVCYQSDKLGDIETNKYNIIENSYKKLSTKYGKGGYAKMYYPDEKYTQFIEEMQEIIENKDKFVELELEIINDISKDR